MERLRFIYAMLEAIKRLAEPNRHINTWHAAQWYQSQFLVDMFANSIKISLSSVCR